MNKVLSLFSGGGSEDEARAPPPSPSYKSLVVAQASERLSAILSRSSRLTRMLSEYAPSFVVTSATSLWAVASGNTQQVNMKPLSPVQLDALLSSMLALTHYILYDALPPSLTTRRRGARSRSRSRHPPGSAQRATTSLTTRPTVIFPTLSERDTCDIVHFASELDAVQTELLALVRDIGRVQAAYRRYYESLLDFCDEKDALFERFLDYYEEYIVGDGGLKPKRTKKKSVTMHQKVQYMFTITVNSNSFNLF